MLTTNCSHRETMSQEHFSIQTLVTDMNITHRHKNNRFGCKTLVNMYFKKNYYQDNIATYIAACYD